MATVTVLVEFKDSKRTVTGKASEIIVKLEEEIKKLDKHVKLVVDVDVSAVIVINSWCAK